MSSSEPRGPGDLRGSAPLHDIDVTIGIAALYVRQGLPSNRSSTAARAPAPRTWPTRRAGSRFPPGRTDLDADCAGRLAVLRDRLHQSLALALPGAVRDNGHPDRRLPNTLNITITGPSGSDLLAAVPGLAASTGSPATPVQRRPRRSCRRWASTMTVPSLRFVCRWDGGAPAPRSTWPLTCSPRPTAVCDPPPTDLTAYCSAYRSPAQPMAIRPRRRDLSRRRPCGRREGPRLATPGTRRSRPSRWWPPAPAATRPRCSMRSPGRRSGSTAGPGR
jgi:hypothetical protein